MENNLEIDVKNAREAGLSYGQYKALQHEQVGASLRKKRKEIRCWQCGGIVKLPRIKYCSDECLRLAYRKNKTPRKGDHNE